jgi:hypothetical protein
MNTLFMADVAIQEHKDWERRFNKRVVRQLAETSLELPQPVRGLVAKLKQGF